MFKLMLVIVLTTLSATSEASYITGQDILNSFEAKRRSEISGAKLVDSLDAIRAAGYIQGVIDAGVSAGIICLNNKGLAVRSTEKIISEYLLSNPNMLRMAAVESIILALHPNYKCDR